MFEIEYITFKINIKYIIFIILIFIFVYIKLKLRLIVKKKTSLNMIGYKLIYTDQSTKEKQKNVIYGKILKSKKYDLQGKPDFIFKGYILGNIVPMELKSGNIGNSKVPHKGDLLQLVSYFIIIQDIYNIKPFYGKLVYKDYMFVVRNTRKLRKEVMRTLNNMRIMMRTGNGRANPSFINCRYCVCKNTVCKYYKR